MRFALLTWWGTRMAAHVGTDARRLVYLGERPAPIAVLVPVPLPPSASHPGSPGPGSRPHLGGDSLPLPLPRPRGLHWPTRSWGPPGTSTATGGRAQLTARQPQVSAPRGPSRGYPALPVNPSREVWVSCSLGRRTLLCTARDFGPAFAARAGGGGSAFGQDGPLP